MRCKYGFYTCEFCGIAEMCRICDDGSNYQMKTNNRGGSRPNAGRKPKYKEATTTVAFRVPVSLVPILKNMVRQLLAKMEV